MVIKTMAARAKINSRDLCSIRLEIQGEIHFRLERGRMPQVLDQVLQGRVWLEEARAQLADADLALDQVLQWAGEALVAHQQRPQDGLLADIQAQAVRSAVRFGHHGA